MDDHDGEPGVDYPRESDEAQFESVAAEVNGTDAPEPWNGLPIWELLPDRAVTPREVAACLPDVDGDRQVVAYTEKDDLRTSTTLDEPRVEHFLVSSVGWRFVVLAPPAGESTLVGDPTDPQFGLPDDDAPRTWRKIRSSDDSHAYDTRDMVHIAVSEGDSVAGREYMSGYPLVENTDHWADVKERKAQYGIMALELAEATRRDLYRESERDRIDGSDEPLAEFIESDVGADAWQ